MKQYTIVWMFEIYCAKRFNVSTMSNFKKWLIQYVNKINRRCSGDNEKIYYWLHLYMYHLGAGPRSRRVRLRSTILNNMEYIECITFSAIYMSTYALSSALPIIFIKIRIRIVEGGNLKMWMKGVVCLPGRRLWRKAGSAEVPLIREDFDPSRSSGCARFYKKFARLRYQRHSRSSSRSSRTEKPFERVPPNFRYTYSKKICEKIFSTCTATSFP